MHKFIEADPDEEVISTIKEITDNINNILEVPRIVELMTDANAPPSETIEDLYNNAAVAAMLLSNVIKGVQSALGNITEKCVDTDILGYDRAVYEKYGIVVPLRVFSPNNLCSQLLNDCCLSDESIVLLKNALTNNPFLHIQFVSYTIAQYFSS